MIQSFAAEHLKTPLGEPIKGRKNKTVAEMWIEKFYKKKTNLPEPIPHELVEKLEQYLDVSISALFSCCFVSACYVAVSDLCIIQNRVLLLSC